ncbi:MAG: Zn-ribbon domain-containing OB-fold protein [Dehalococcoidales bacterium]|nr:Zn-ribbon domain-containing OB-fold protein [Dehalococcoidales bacterium]
MTINEATPKANKPIPVMRFLKLSEDAKTGVFLGKKCRTCGEFYVGFPIFCLKCSSTDLAPVELSKEGTLRTYTVIYTPPAGWQGAVPYTLGDVDLAEGVSLLAEVIDLPKEDIKIGMKMRMVLRIGGKDTEGNDIMVYKWQPVK